MTNHDDLISREAALAIVAPMAYSNSLIAANAGQSAANALRALPAVTVGVKPLAELKRYDLDQPDSHMGSAIMVLEQCGDWVRFDDLAALESQPAPSPDVAALVPFLETADQASRAQLVALCRDLLAVTVTDPYIRTGVKDRDGREICVGDRIRIDLSGPATNREYWNPEYEVVFKPPHFTIRHVGGDKSSDTAHFYWRVPQRSSTEKITTIYAANTSQPTLPDVAALVEALPKRCDGIEQEAFEAWAKSAGYDMTTHPLHWLFLDAKTDAARYGWAAGLSHASQRMQSAIAALRGEVKNG